MLGLGLLAGHVLGTSQYDDNILKTTTTFTQLDIYIYIYKINMTFPCVSIIKSDTFDTDMLIFIPYGC